MALTITSRGPFGSNTSQTSYQLTVGANLTAGALVVYGIAYDNNGSLGADQGMSLADSAGNTWTLRSSTLRDPGTTGAGLVLRIYTTKQDVGTLTSSSTITATFGNLTVAKSVVLWEITSDKSNPQYSTTGTAAAGASTAPSVTTGTIVVNQATIGIIGYEYAENPSADDTDTTNGSWSTAQGTNFGSGVGGMSIRSQYKVQTTTNSTQTYNVTYTNSSDWIASWISATEFGLQYAQARASIKQTYTSFAQAQSWLGFFGYSNAQALIQKGLLITAKGTNFSEGSALSFNLSPASNFNLGSLAVIALAYDNSGTEGVDPIASVTDTLGNTWETRHVTVNDPSTVTSTGAIIRFLTTSQDGGTLTTGTTITVTFGTAVSAKAYALWEVSSNTGIPAYLSTGTGATGAGTTPSVTSGTITVNTAIIAAVAYEYGQGPTTLDTDTTNGSWSSGQSSYTTGTTSGMSIVSQFKIQTSSNSTQTYNPTYTNTSDWAAGWISVVSLNLVSAQALAQITSNTVTYTQYAQAASSINQTYTQYAQANTSIIGAVIKFAQAQSSILTTYIQFAQTQSSILSTYNQFGQSQATLYTQNYKHAQANASIILVKQTYAQIQAQIKSNYQSYAQASANIIATFQQFAQAQANLPYLGPIAYAQALASIWNGLWLFTRGTKSYPSSDASATLTLNPSQNFSEDSLAVLVVGYGNYGSAGADQGCTVSDSLGNTWTVRHVTVNDPSIVQGAGTVLRFFTTEQNVSLLTTGTTITASLGNGSIGKVMGLWEVKSNVRRSPRYWSTGTGATGNSASPSVTSSTITVDDAIIGAVAHPYGESYATLDTDSTNGNWSGPLSVWEGSGGNGQSVVSQFKIQITANSTQTYNPTYTNGQNWAAGWISIRLIPYQRFAQAKASIRVFGNIAPAQAQAELIQGTRYNVHAQAKASIIPRFNVFAQSKTSIKTNYWGFAQAAARMAIYSQHGQAQADIRTTYYQTAQSAAQIFNITKVQHAQAQALIPYSAVSALGIRVLGQVTPTVETSSFNLRILTNRATVNSANAAAQIQNLTNTAQVFAQSIAYIKLEGRTGFAQAQAWVHVFAVSSMYIRTLAAIAPDIHVTAGAIRVLTNRGTLVSGQANALINSPIKIVVAQAHVSIYRTPHTTYSGLAQAQADTKARYNQSANARASIKRIYTQSSQAQAFIFHPQAFAQARATILRTGYRGYAQAAAYMRLYVGYAQSQAYISMTSRKYAQAGAYMRLYVGYGQAQAQIKNTYIGHAQATIYVRLPAGYAQANADIRQTYYPVAQANALIDSISKVAFAQAQATLIFVGVTSFYLHILTSVSPYARVTSLGLRTIVNRATFKSAQAAAVVYSITKVASGQAGAKVKNKYPQSANTVAHIRAIGVPQSAQSMADILKLAGYGQARAYMRSFDQPVFAQAQAYSLGETYTHGQAGAYIRPLTGNALAQASVRTTYTKFSQTQAMIEIQRRGYAHTQAWILDSTSFYIGTAQAWIVYQLSANAQTQADITRYKFGWANAMARISGHQHSQAQANIKTKPNGFAQSQAFITNKYTIILYNDYLLPGYLQSESIQRSSRLRISGYPYINGEDADYMGLENKVISLRFKLVGSTYDEMKTQATRASTMVWSAREWSKLYIHTLDKYYLAIPKTFKIDSSASNKTLDYSVDFTAQPWLYSDSINTITGTTSLVTTGRTISDGVETPATIRVTGTNVTVSGYTADGTLTGYFAVSGAVVNLMIDSENYTATINGVNRNDIMRNLDYQIYVGQGITYFDITGASSAEISWRNRW